MSEAGQVLLDSKERSSSVVTAAPDGPGAIAARPKLKRSSIACRRCRRLRTKCLQDGQPQTPCLPCRRAGPSEARSCAFAERGDNADRKVRTMKFTHHTSLL
ncbi:hypothetical protein F4778DRAFT_241921 [Xylariomycetidae sp. FL2044]|nr:hypothetical protein F4778DRAFT_241921 [Xylariomycetidae sp. FL2044]